MEFISTQKFLLISPKKIRPLANVVRSLNPQRALEVLPFTRKRGAEPLAKVIKSAVKAATAKGVSLEKLAIKEIQVMEGPRLKRGRPVSRGRWHPIKKRMSHIRVILEEVKKDGTKG